MTWSCHWYHSLTPTCWLCPTCAQVCRVKFLLFSHFSITGYCGWCCQVSLPLFLPHIQNTTMVYHSSPCFYCWPVPLLWTDLTPHSSWPLIMSWSRLFQSPRGYLPADSLVLCKNLDIWLPDPPTARLHLMLPLQELDLGLRPFNCAIFSQPLQMRLFHPSHQTGLLDLANKVQDTQSNLNFR